MSEPTTKKFRVLKREVWVQTIEIEAATEHMALALVANGNGEIVEGALEYSHDLPRDTWTVEDGES